MRQRDNRTPFPQHQISSEARSTLASLSDRGAGALGSLRGSCPKSSWSKVTSGRLSPRRLATLFALPALAVLLVGCPDQSSEQLQVRISASANSVFADGSNTVTITVTANEGDSPAPGQVFLTTNKGTFAGGGNALQETLVDGRLEALLVTCDSRQDAGCAGIANVRADMGARNASVNITFRDEAGPIEDPMCDPLFTPVDSCEEVETCLDLPCGPHGLLCDEQGECSCPSGVTDESQASVPAGTFACGDGVDHDCDGLTDCEDSDCEGEPCGLHEMVCSGGACVCTHGFQREWDAQATLDQQGDLTGNARFACGDGVDWDCDGLIDCQDDDCAERACGDHGRVCSEGSCICPGGVTNESLAQVPPGTYACGDGIDHDCDGHVDCADPDCHTLSCANGMICDFALRDCVVDPSLEQVTFWHEGSDRVLADDATEVPLWVEIRSGDFPLDGEDVTFTVQGGAFASNGLQSLSAKTNALGRASVVWLPGATPARDLGATVTVDTTGTSKSIKIQVIGLSTISVQSVQYPVMGVAQSGYRETNVVAFTLRGTDGINANLPMPDGVPVAFDTGGIVAGGLRLTNTTASSVGGLVETTAVAGTMATTFAVTAVATLAGDTKHVTTAPIAIVGAKPSQTGMTLDCNRLNVGSYARHDGTNSQVDISVQCTVSLKDRFGNPIGIATPVSFMAEGGSIVSPVMTSTAPATLGQATTTFKTLGALPRRVAPIENEPSVVIGEGQDQEVRNPRDGLVAIMAYTTGEESFVDLNGNGIWDQGEPFVDMGEPFLDTNDSGVFESGKPFINHTGSGVYDGPNGIWDSNTLIWTETRILATGDPRSESFSGFHPNSDIEVPWDGETTVMLRMADENLNPPRQGTSTALSITDPSTNPPIAIAFSGGGGTSYTYPDAGWGSSTDSHIRWRRLVVCADEPATTCDGCNCGVCPGNRCTLRSRASFASSERWGHQHTVRLTRLARPERSFEIRSSYNGTTPATTYFARGMAMPEVEPGPDPDTEIIELWHEGPPRVLAGHDTEVPLVARVTLAGNPVAGASVIFSVAGGTIAENSLATYTVDTTAEGTARATWKPGTSPARNLRATAELAGGSTPDFVEIQVIGLASIIVDSLQHTVMGVAESGYRETNNIVFRLRGTDGTSNDLTMPDGVAVTFDTSGNAMGGLHLTNYSAQSTNSLVQTTAISGTAATNFSVRAEATVAGVTREATTASIAIVGAKPSQSGMTLNCNRLNVGSYAQHDGTNSQVDITVQCTVTLQDRFGNPIGVATSVSFMAEGGSIVSPVTTSTAPATLGQATTTFRTLGRLPNRVEPVENEPFVIIGEGAEEAKKNPRDGFITIMAFAAGEEAFVDLNGNGVWDPGEPFIDLGEPFLDTDDSGVWQPGKPFVDFSGSGTYDGPNGSWDGNTLVWTETRILATGNPDAASGAGFEPSSDILVPWASQATVQLKMADENLNPPRSGTGATLAITEPSTGAPISIAFAGGGGTSFTYPDWGWGSSVDSHIRWRRQIVCADNPADVCDGCNCGRCADNRCIIRGRVGPFSGNRIGYPHEVRLTRNTQPSRSFEIRAAYNGTSPHTNLFATGLALAQPPPDPDPDPEVLSFWHEGPSRVLASDSTEVPLIVEVRAGTDPVVGETAVFTVDGGTLSESGLDTFTTVTNENGRAFATWKPGITPARDLRATVTAAGITDVVRIQVIGLSNISVHSVQHTLMGVAQSGYRESNNVFFLVRGTDGIEADLAMPDGVAVAFDTGGNVTGGLHLTNATATTASGIVQTTAVSGTAATTFAVNAVATLSGTLSDVTTPSIAVVGAKPSQSGMTLSCNRRNVGSYAEHDGTNSTVDISVNCTVTLQDRFGNPIGVPTQVNFMAEAGTVVSPVTTNAAGQATTTFRTLGNLPRRVAPVEGEPFVEIGEGADKEIFNPRDGLIAIMAYTTGEEAFVDLNGNGVWDPDEPFIDMGEPFVDNNDSGVWESGKPFVDHTGSGNYDGPNGVWNSNTLIWTETRILATGNPAQVTTDPSIDPLLGYSPKSGITVPWAGSADVALRIADANLNPPRPQTATALSVSYPTTTPPVSVAFAGTGGTSFTYPDWGWGNTADSHIRWRRQVVCADATTQICDGCNCPDSPCTENRCTFLSRIGPFDPSRWGYRHLVRITRTTARKEGSDFEIRASYNGTSPATTFFTEGYAEPE